MLETKEIKNLRLEKFSEQMNSNKNGITLIALVITIVVLLILAGVTIGTLTGDNGVLNQASTAKEQTLEKETLEQINLAVIASKTNENAKIDPEVLENELKGYFGDDVTGDSTNGWTVKSGKNTYIVSADGEVESTEVDWEQAKANATKHPNQSAENEDISIGTDGKPVNLDLWSYSIINGNEISLTGYDDSNIVSGKIIGKVPQYIKISGNDEFYEVTSMSTTFENSTALKYAPAIPGTVKEMSSTFDGCVVLESVPVVPSSVTSMIRTFYSCVKLKGKLIINAQIEMNIYGQPVCYNCLTGASTDASANLKISGTSPNLNDILATKSSNSNISLEE